MAIEAVTDARSAGVPAPEVDAALRRPGTAHLVVTHCGYTSGPRGHGVNRPDGLPNTLVLISVGGHGWVEVAGRRHGLEPGQLVLIPPDVPHGFYNPTDETWKLWWLHAVGPDIPELLRMSGLTTAAPIREVAEPFRIVALIEEVFRTLARDVTEPSMLAASGAAWHLFALLLATSRASGDIVSPVDRARDYLREHFAEHLTVEQLARLTNFSRSHFAAVFRRRFGVAVLEYQAQLRMARARELLESTDRSVIQIANEVGYPDPSYFARRFQAVHGLAPRHYRERRSRMSVTPGT